MRKRRSERGLTLIELGAAAVVVAVALLGTTAAVISGASLSDEITRMSTVSRAATSIVEQVRATDFAEIVDTYDGQTIPIGYSASGVDDGTATISVVQVENGSETQILYQVSIEITFEGATGNQTYPIVTYVSDRVAGSGLFDAPEVPTETPVQDPIQQEPL